MFCGYIFGKKSSIQILTVKQSVLMKGTYTMLFHILLAELSEKDQDFVLSIYNDYGKIMYKTGF